MHTKLDASSLFLGRPMEVKASPAGHIEGLASVFGEEDSYGDIIEKGAFGKTLEEHRASRSMPLMLWSHKTDQPIGRWDQMEQTSEGLVAKGRLNLKTTAGNDAFEAIRFGSVSGLSIGFNIPQGGAEMNAKGLRIIKQLVLHEVSVVAFPAAARARIESIKSAGDVQRILRAAGLADRAAKKMALGAFAALSGEDPEALEAKARQDAENSQLQSIARMMGDTLKRI